MSLWRNETLVSCTKMLSGSQLTSGTESCDDLRCGLKHFRDRDLMSMGLWSHSPQKWPHTQKQTHTHTHKHTHTHTNTHTQPTSLTNYNSARAVALRSWRRWHWVYMALHFGTGRQPHSQLSLWSPSSFRASSNTICYFWFYPSSLGIPLPEVNFFVQCVCVCVFVCV